MPGMGAPDDDTKAQTFITRWQGVTASELATSQSFFRDLCDLLGTLEAVGRARATAQGWRA